MKNVKLTEGELRDELVGELADAVNQLREGDAGGFDSDLVAIVVVASHARREWAESGYGDEDDRDDNEEGDAR